MKEIYTSNHMWMLFENFLIDMAMVSGTPLKDESGVACTDYCQFEITAMTWIAQYEKLASWGFRRIDFVIYGFPHDMFFHQIQGRGSSINAFNKMIGWWLFSKHIGLHRTLRVVMWHKLRPMRGKSQYGCEPTRRQTRAWFPSGAWDDSCCSSSDNLRRVNVKSMTQVKVFWAWAANFVSSSTWKQGPDVVRGLTCTCTMAL